MSLELSTRCCCCCPRTSDTLDAVTHHCNCCMLLACIKLSAVGSQAAVSELGTAITALQEASCCCQLFRSCCGLIHPCHSRLQAMAQALAQLLKDFISSASTFPPLKAQAAIRHHHDVCFQCCSYAGHPMQREMHLWVKLSTVDDSTAVHCMLTACLWAPDNWQLAVT